MSVLTHIHKTKSSTEKKENPVHARRLGIITIAMDLIRDHPDAMRRALNNMLIVDAKSNFAYNTIEYMGYSEHFEPIDEGAMAPHYTVEVKVDETVEVNFSSGDPNPSSPV